MASSLRAVLPLRSHRPAVALCDDPDLFDRLTVAVERAVSADDQHAHETTASSAAYARRSSSARRWIPFAIGGLAIAAALLALVYVRLPLTTARSAAPRTATASPLPFPALLAMRLDAAAATSTFRTGDSESRYPKSAGAVLSVDGREIEIDAGSLDGLQRGTSVRVTTADGASVRAMIGTVFRERARPNGVRGSATARWRPRRRTGSRTSERVARTGERTSSGGRPFRCRNVCRAGCIARQHSRRRARTSGVARSNSSGSSLEIGTGALIDRFAISYVPAGRNIAEATASSAEGPAVVVVNSGDLTRAAVEPLRAAAAEAADVRRVLAASELYADAAATEQHVKNLHRPSLLHIVGHGVVRGQDNCADRTCLPLDRATQAMSLAAIVLEEAYGRSGRSSDDGWLTALELENLDLRGTQMLVLSQCQMATGLASVGEGVYGIPHFFAGDAGSSSSSTTTAQFLCARERAHRDPHSLTRGQSARLIRSLRTNYFSPS